MQNVIDNYYNFLLYSTMISFLTYSVDFKSKSNYVARFLKI